MQVDHTKLIGVDAYLESGKSRCHVGILSKSDDGYTFEYNAKYLRMNTAISIGVDLPLTKKKFVSKKFFESLADRIPSKKNIAYAEYCARFGIEVEENDPLVLLATIGSRGASSIVFEPVFPALITRKDLKEFRVEIGLSVRDFALLFDVSSKALTSIENEASSGRDTMKRMQIYLLFPDVALFEINRNRPKVHRETFDKTERLLRGRLDEAGDN